MPDRDLPVPERPQPFPAAPVSRSESLEAELAALDAILPDAPAAEPAPAPTDRAAGADRRAP